MCQHVQGGDNEIGNLIPSPIFLIFKNTMTKNSSLLEIRYKNNILYNCKKNKN